MSREKVTLGVHRIVLHREMLMSADESPEDKRIIPSLLDRIDEGRRQLDEGEYTDYGDSSLGQRFRELKVRARKAADYHG